MINLEKKTFVIREKVWKWPGIAGWHFVALDKKVSSKIKKIGKPYGAGFIKIEAMIGETKWSTALFPHKKSEVYLLSVKKNIRKKEDVWDGDTIKIKILVA